jgi:hypothetical protein
MRKILINISALLINGTVAVIIGPATVPRCMPFIYGYVTGT